MAQTKLTIAPSPHDSVTVRPVGQDRVFNRIFNADTEQFRDLHVIVHKSDSRAIVALVGIFKYTDVHGVPRTVVVKTDSWQRPLNGPNDKAEIVPANSRTLFGPSANIPEKMVGGPGIGNGIMPQQFHGLYGFTNPSFAIDLLVFADGETVGPDSRHVMTEFSARYDASQAVVNAWKTGGVPAVQLLAAGLFISPASSDPQKQTESWITRYASQLSHSQVANQSAYINYLANSPKPISLFRVN
jgi:hypothetical protein